MATSANPMGAIPTNGAGGPFTNSPTHAHPAPLRYASFDNDQFSTYSTSSPSHAKRALEAHLKDTDRRIQDASKLGTTLLQQRKDLAARLKDVEQAQQSGQVPDDLRKKLSELEKEYNEIGKESARAFLPKSRMTSESLDSSRAPSVLSTHSKESPSKVTAPNRRQRNQPSNRVHDIEFATEISTQLLAQVRQLQAALAEKDDEHKDALAAKARLESDVAGLAQRMKHMDESEQRYKDENWNLETKIQDLETSFRDATDKHEGLGRTLKSTESEKAVAQRELDDLKVSHEKLNEDHTLVKRQLDTDLNALRRDAGIHNTEKASLQKKIEELTAQNTELAKAVSYRWNQSNQPTEREATTPDNDDSVDDATPPMSTDASPVKGTPARGGILEAETMKSSLNHAHRMIQNLKNNIHREKTEKVELKRMLSDARDELERRRDSGAGAKANESKKRRSDSDNGKFKKPARPDRLGANRNSTTEILEDEPDWEDHEGERTPSKSRVAAGVAGVALAGAAGTTAFDHARAGAAYDTTTDADDFETADEARDTATETEAFQTGAEEMARDSSEGDLTEIETGSGINRSGTIRGRGVSPLVGAKAGDRRSFQSTASTSADEADEIHTPVQAQQPKYRLRLNRNGRRSGRASDLFSDSPASSTGTPQPAGQSLGDELDGLDEGTPRSSYLDSAAPTPEASRHASVSPEKSAAEEGEGEEIERSAVQTQDDAGDGPQIGSPTLSPKPTRPEGEEAERAHQAHAAMLAHEFAVSRPKIVDAGMMTEPWEPESESRVVAADALSEEEPHKQTFRERAGDAIGGALAGFGLGRLMPDKASDQDVAAEDGDGAAAPSVDFVERSISPEDKAPAAGALASSEGQALAGGEVQPEQSKNVLAEPEPEPVPADEPKSLSSTVAEPLRAAKSMESMHLMQQQHQLGQSSLTTQETEPVTPTRPLTANRRPSTPRSPGGLQRLTDAASKRDMSFVGGVPFGAPGAQQDQQVSFSFSPVVAQDFEPVDMPEYPHTPMLPKRSSKRLDAMYDDDEPTPTDVQDFGDNLPGTDGARPGAGFFSSSPLLPPVPLKRTRSQSLPAQKRAEVYPDGTTASVIEPRIFAGGEGSGGIPTLVFGDEESPPLPSAPSETAFGQLPRRTDSLNAPRAPLADLPPNIGQAGQERTISNESMIPPTKPLQIRKAMVDEGSQTAVSGQDIDGMLRDKSRMPVAAAAGVVGAAAGAGAVAAYQPTGSSPRRSADSSVSGAGSLRRPASVGSVRNKAVLPAPPLPPDYGNKIVAAGGKAPATPGPAPMGTMGPPTMPASAYRQNRQSRPQTPSERARTMSRDGTTPRPVRPRDSRQDVQSPSAVSRRTSVSSFASELDERFNITRGQLMYPDDVTPATDPRMIQAITQTMIGEYLWKYTRKAGRSEASSTRHRRFFWVHPYTRTLYWSERDPSTAGRDGGKAKSVQIESVRVVTDDNTNPPGLHRKSLVVVTPGREIIFTAPTGQRHETWFNALSYLLLRTEQEKEEAEDTINEDDLAEFNPGGFSIRRSISRLTGRSQSRLSLSSYNSRTTRTSSPQRAQEQGSLARRQAAAAARAKGASTPTPTPNPNQGSMASRTSTMRDSGRLSSLASKLRSGSMRGSFSSKRGRPSMSTRASSRTGENGEIYDASVVGDSAEDLRAVIERQEKDADRLENVRACCDGKFEREKSEVPLLTRCVGKHDVGSIPRTGRHASLTSRLSSNSRHAHSHSHAHPRAEPMSVSSRPRRGE